MTCTAPTHTITAAEAAAGQVHNVATATGDGVNGDPVTSNEGHASVAVHATPNPPPPPLASTGSDIQLELTMVGLLLGAGSLLSLAGTRRRRRG
jgi:LPXTG-motif cell wall-anchored protein